MDELDTDIHEIDTTGLKLLHDNLEMLVWDMGDGRIIRVSNRTESLEQAQHVLEVYDAAFRATGMTPRPYEVVRVGDRFGVVVEFVRGLSLGVHLAFGTYSPSEAGKEFGEIALRMHRARMRSGYDMRSTYIAMARYAGAHLPDAHMRRLVGLIEDIPDRDTFLHGDIHPGNVIVNKEGTRLIDMDSVGFGHPVFDLACMKAVMFKEVPEKVTELGITLETGAVGVKTIWDAVLQTYFSGWDEDEVAAIAVRIDILAHLTHCCGGAVYFGDDSEAARYWFEEHIGPFGELLRDALPQVDRLDF